MPPDSCCRCCGRWAPGDPETGAAEDLCPDCAEQEPDPDEQDEEGGVPTCLGCGEVRPEHTQAGEHWRRIGGVSRWDAPHWEPCGVVRLRRERP